MKNETLVKIQISSLYSLIPFYSEFGVDTYEKALEHIQSVSLNKPIIWIKKGIQTDYIDGVSYKIVRYRERK